MNGSTRPEGIETSFFSSGQFQKSSDWQTFKVVSPATGETVAEPYEASVRDVDAAVAAAAKAASPGLQVLSRTTACSRAVLMPNQIESLNFVVEFYQ